MVLNYQIDKVMGDNIKCLNFKTENLQGREFSPCGINRVNLKLNMKQRQKYFVKQKIPLYIEFGSLRSNDLTR